MPTAPVRAMKSVRSRGLGATARIGRREIRRRTRHRLNVLAEHRFDRRLGVETTGNVRQPGLGLPGTEFEDSRMYTPTPVPLLRSLLRSLPIEPARFTFVDVGSGKGRAPLVAADMGFRQAIGIELSDELHATAKENAARYHERSGAQAGQVAFVHADATTYSFPSEPLVLFLYDPFGERTLRVVAQNLASAVDQDAAEIYVVYFAPDYPAVFDEMAWLTRLAEGEQWCSWGPAQAPPRA